MTNGTSRSPSPTKHISDSSLNYCSNKTALFNIIPKMGAIVKVLFIIKEEKVN